jgi:hypothetical protein
MTGYNPFGKIAHGQKALSEMTVPKGFSAAASIFSAAESGEKARVLLLIPNECVVECAGVCGALG